MSTPKHSLSIRMMILAGGFLLLPAGIVVQILRIQLSSGEELRTLWREQAEDFVPIPSLRGDILDTNGKILATSSVAYTVAVDPLVPGMTREKLRTIVQALARTSGKDADSYLRKIQQSPPGSRYIVLERGMGVSTYEALTALEIRGIILEEQYRRRFNYGRLAAHTLGYVNMNVDGMMGLEAYYNDILRGEDGTQQVRRDRTGRIKAYVGAPKKKPVNGHTLVTTIDVNMQAVVEEELALGVRAVNADYGTAIVMDPLTGAIKAMANYPTYDPNNPGQPNENRRNFAIADMIEPGSTFKLVTAIAALEAGVVQEDESFYTPSDGQRLIYGQWMRDHDPLGTLTFTEVFSRSSNVATAEIAMRIKPEVYYQYVRNLGFGTATQVDLPSEEAGRLRKPYDWSRVTLPWMSIGYEIQVTPLQLALAYAAFANGGDLLRPYVVESILDDRMNPVKTTKPLRIRKVSDPATLQTLLPVFEQAVSEKGTGRHAMVAGMTIAGKTGTAQKFSDGSYRSRYRSSFAGFFPSRNPRYVTVVILDEPKTQIYGGEVAAPIFSNIANRLLGLDEELQHRVKAHENGRTFVAAVPKIEGLSREEASRILSAQGIPFQMEGNGDLVARQTPEAGQPLSAGDAMVISTRVNPANNTDEAASVMPDLTGMSMRRAYFIAQELGLSVSVSGHGHVREQNPKAGADIRKGQTVSLRGGTANIIRTGGS